MPGLASAAIRRTSQWHSLTPSGGCSKAAADAALCKLQCSYAPMRSFYRDLLDKEVPPTCQEGSYCGDGSKCVQVGARALNTCTADLAGCCLG